MPDQELIARLKDGDRRIESFAALDAPTHGRSYAPGKWSGAAILAHIADADVCFYARFLKAIAEPGTTIVTFDQNVWMAELGGTSRPVPTSLAMLRAVTAGLAHQLATVSPASLRRTSEHPERGTMSANDMALMIVKHREHHLGQLEAIREGRSWTIAEKVAY